ncbi:MAG: HAMP domain-containing histidine kinase [Nocardiopsaceae bacterium]|nr:HAMP domain-containing histidine kinase [Nocardiopsaceae bacterium]
MRQHLSLLVSAVMALTLVAFAIPLAILIRVIVADHAIARANEQIRGLSTLVAANPDPANVRVNVQAASKSMPMTVFLPGHRPIGDAPQTPAVRLAALRRESFTVTEPGGRQLLVAVGGLPQNQAAVVSAFVPNSELTAGVTKSWLILGGLCLLLLAVGIVIANLLVGTVTKPISELARVSHRLAAGGLEARASPDGPPEVRELAHGLNHLAGRIRDLIHQERESVADLSHRLRTPLTALRLELEGMGNAADPEGRLSEQVLALEGAVTSLIEDARTRGSTQHGSCDAAEVTRRRAKFWSVLSDDQGRTMRLDLVPGPVMVGVAEPELGACLDALLGNVFAHTPQGTGFAIALRPRERGGGVLTVHDDGPGFAQTDPVRRGASGGGSTGLGLDIARQTAEASGGTLTIRPGPGGHVVVELGPPSDT